MRGEADPEAVAVAAWIRRHDEIVGPTASNFAWVFLGYLAWAPALLVSQWAKRTFTVEASARSLPSLDSIHVRPARTPSSRKPPASATDAGVPAGRRQEKSSTSHAAQAAQIVEGLQHSAYVVRPLLSPKSFIVDPDHEILAPADGSVQKVVFRSRVTPGVFNFGFPLRVLGAEGNRELLLITKKRISLMSVAYRVSIPSTQETLGVFVKTGPRGDHWLLGDGDGRQIGWIARVALRPVQRYEARIEEAPVCHFTIRKLWREMLLGRVQVEVAFHQEGARALDKRLGLAFGVLLERHVGSRTFS